MLPDALAGVPVTAIGVALIRANESRRPDRLFDDPYAAMFVDAAEAEFSGPAADAEAAEIWARLLSLAAAMEQRAVSVRFLESYLLDGVASGCGQVVELGAGLDTYALRLPWRHRCRYFEIDLPPMLTFRGACSKAGEPTPATAVRCPPTCRATG